MVTRGSVGGGNVSYHQGTQVDVQLATPTRAQVETAVRSGTFKNLTTGEVKFDKNGDRMTAKMYVIAVKDGNRSTAGTVNVIRK